MVNYFGVLAFVKKAQEEGTKSVNIRLHDDGNKCRVQLDKDSGNVIDEETKIDCSDLKDLCERYNMEGYTTHIFGTAKRAVLTIEF